MDISLSSPVLLRRVFEVLLQLQYESSGETWVVLMGSLWRDLAGSPPTSWCNRLITTIIFRNLRVWAAVSSCALATLNSLLYRRLNRSRTSVLLSVAPFVGLALLVAEGGWQQFVAYVALAVGALTGVIVWLAKKTIHED